MPTMPHSIPTSHLVTLQPPYSTAIWQCYDAVPALHQLERYVSALHHHSGDYDDQLCHCRDEPVLLGNPNEGTEPGKSVTVSCSDLHHHYSGDYGGQLYE